MAVVGMACRFPGGASSPARFWELLSRGANAVTEIPGDRFPLESLYDPDPGVPGALYTRHGAFIELPEAFDAEFFGVSPREARRVDPQQRLLLEVAWEALEDAGYPHDGLAGSKTGVFVGISSHDYGQAQFDPSARGAIDAYAPTGGAISIAANRLSYVLDLRGPSLAVDTACSSSLTAIHLACRSIAAGDCDLALVCGVNVLLAPEIWVGFCKAGLLSPDGRCRPFDRDANGYVRGEGAGCVLLRPLEQALEDRDRVHAVIRAAAVNQDGRTVGISMPNADAQATLMREALALAGVAPADVQYVEAHGTGTAAGDPAEAIAIGRVLAAGRPPGERCLVGSVKGNIGHLEAAAGMAGLIKAVLVLKHRRVPPTVGHAVPSTAIPWDELPLRVPTSLESLAHVEAPHACVNSFGFGGANAQVVLEGPPAEREPLLEDDGRVRVAVLSARSPAALDVLADEWVRMLERAPEPSLRDVCHTAALRRSHHRHRLAVVTGSREELIVQLSRRRAGEDAPRVVAGTASFSGAPKVAFVFSGMGSERAAMGRELMESEPVFQTSLIESDRIVHDLAGWSLLAALAADPAGPGIERADVAQVANVALQIALARLWQSWGVAPHALVGHSTGEAAAACVAGALTVEEALAVSYHRGRLQQRLAGSGGMLAVGLSAELATELIGAHGSTVALAAINAPSLVTLSGSRGTLAQIRGELEDRGVFVRPVATDVPYHSPQLDCLHDELVASLAALDGRAAVVPIVSTVTGDWMKDQRFDAQHWWRTVREPVRFARAAERLLEDGVDCVVEVGAHPVLGGALRECIAASERECAVLASLRRAESEPETMLRSLASLHVRACPVDWSAALGTGGRVVDLPTYPWQRTRHWAAPARSADAGQQPMDGRDAGHPLLGRRLHAARPTWEANLADGRLSFLADHAIGGVAVFPAAGYVAMALAATRTLAGKRGPSIQHLEFVRMLSLPPGRAPIVQCSIDEGGATLEIHAASDVDGWTLHARGRLGTQPLLADRVDLDDLRARCHVAGRTAAMYAEAARRADTRYGPAFRGVSALWRGRNEALARVIAPPTLDLDGYAAHPALLDAAFQAAAAVVAAGIRPPEGPVLPVGIDRIEQQRPLPATFWAHATVREDEAGFVGDVRALDEAGEVLLLCQGVRLQPLGGRRRSPGSSWLYREDWQPLPPPPQGARGPLDPHASAATARKALASAAAHAGLHDYYERAEPMLSALAASYAERTVREIGWHASTHGATLDDAAEHLGVAPGRLRLWQRVLTMATGAGTGKHESATDAAWWREHPSCEPLLRLVQESGVHLEATLRGHEDAREWLFSGDPWETLVQVYADSPPQRVANLATAHAVAAASRSAGPLRILEVGAGSCATTGAILDALDEPPAAYLVTDISPLLVRRARERLAARGVLFATMDVERPPSAYHGVFDVVVAANVVHATPDLRATLRHLRTMLAPGGLLVLQELIRRSAWLDLVFGQLEGWWLAGDDLREEHPLAGLAEWRRALAETGFAAEEILADEPPDGRDPAQAVILARAGRALPETASDADGQRWLVLADRGGVGERVEAALVRDGHRVTLVRRDAECGDSASDDHDRPTHAYDWSDLLEADGPVHGVVHLWALDAPTESGLQTETLMNTQDITCGSLVALARAARTRHSLAEVWIVTAGAQSVGVGEDVSVAQAPIWGVGRVLRNERPDLRCRLVDLGRATPACDVDVFLGELTTRGWPGRSADLAIRDGVLLAPRLARAPLDVEEESVPLVCSPATDCFRLEAPTAGGLAGFTLRATHHREPGPGEVEILVGAAALNFRDVLYTLGTLESDRHGSPELGVECFGRVVACGEGVLHVRPGDDVITICSRSFASRVVTRSELVVRAPAGLTPEEAATLPAAFGTALLALRQVARLQAGERVLVHSAAGGVGLAAVQLARLAGAEIFATASTDEKRAYLSSVGAAHVMDSRSLAFVDEVLRLTGGEGVDVVLNSLSGEAIPRSVELLRPGGRFVELGKRDTARNAPLGLRPFRRGLTFATVSFETLPAEKPEAVGTLLRELVEEVEAGRLEPLPHTVFDLADAEHAFRLMAQAGHIGRIVLGLYRSSYAVEGTRAHRLRPDATYLVAGGLGGLGLSLARHLAARGARHLVLASRRGAPDPEDAPALEALRADGVEVVAVSCDVSRTEDVAQVLHEVRTTMPPLRGVVHSAMVLDDVVIEQLDLPRLRAVLAPKVAGAWNLHTLTHEDELDFFLLLSSIASHLALPGQANYTAANAFLDALAGHRRSLGLPALAVDLGALADAGHVARHPELAGNLGRVGIEGLAPEDVWEVVDSLLGADVGRAVVAGVDWEALTSGPGAALTIAPPAEDGDAVASHPGGEAARDLRAELLGLSPADRADVVERHLALTVARVLEAPPERLDPERPLVELGLDSLMAVELMAIVQREVGAAIALGELLEGMTLRDLATAAVRQCTPAVPA